MATAINEGCMSFIQAEGIIKQLNIPLYVHVLRSLWKTTLTFGHNLIILPIVFFVSSSALGLEIFLFPIGLALLIVNLAWIMTLLGILSARYRDLPPIVSSLMTIAFYVTPVMWSPSLLPAGTAHLLLGLNPLYHLLQIVRLPLLAQFPTLENWILSATFAIVGWVAVSLVMKKFKSQIAFWL
jgi:lipopolysaccharide transport system permease protein